MLGRHNTVLQKNFYDRQFKKLASKAMEFNIRNFYFEKLVSILEEHKKPKEGDKLLELGVGEGLLMHKMAHRFNGCEYKGIDISEKNVETAKSLGLDVEVDDASDLHISGKFDLIYGTAILHHLDNLEFFFDNLLKSLHSDGVILFGAEPVYYEFFYIIYHLLRGSWHAEKGMLNISVRRLCYILSKGYKNIKVYRHGNPFVYAFTTLGKIWNFTGLSKIPFLNDIYIYAEKK